MTYSSERASVPRIGRDEPAREGEVALELLDAMDEAGVVGAQRGDAALVLAVALVAEEAREQRQRAQPGAGGAMGGDKRVQRRAQRELVIVGRRGGHAALVPSP